MGPGNISLPSVLLSNLVSATNVDLKIILIKNAKRLNMHWQTAFTVEKKVILQEIALTMQRVCIKKEEPVLDADLLDIH